jgi:hypothetical protein
MAHGTPIELQPVDASRRPSAPGAKDAPSASFQFLRLGCGVVFLAPIAAFIGATVIATDGWSFLFFLVTSELIAVTLAMLGTATQRRKRRPSLLQQHLGRLGFRRRGESHQRREGQHLEHVAFTGGTTKSQALSIWVEPAPGWTVAPWAAGRTVLGSPATGASEFDDVVGVRDPTGWSRAVLTREVRESLAEAVRRHDVEITHGRLHVPLIHVRWMKRDAFTRQLTWWQALAAALVVPTDALVERLRAVLHSEVEPPALRAGAFADLEQHAPGWPQRAADLRAVIEQGNAALILRLGELLGAELRAELRALLDHPSEHLRTRAFAAFCPTVPQAQWPEVFTPLLTHRELEIRAGALDQLTRISHPLPTQVLASLHSDDAIPVRRRLITWYRSQPDALAEAGALRLLNDTTEIFAPAAALLGKVGGMKSIAALLPFEDRSKTRAAAEHALRLIRARLPEGAAAGGLALVESEQIGGLALADETGLALTDEPLVQD